MRKSARRMIVSVAAAATVGLSSIAFGGIGHQAAGSDPADLGTSPMVTSSSDVELAGQGNWPFRWRP
ncbi:MAG: hypothetical protein ACK5IM_10490 [Demequina sp.]|uniref:hypothetical protein n=1 Tax=Demequina sp. TaxID=2050685 RepID=UPI003A87898D